MFMKMFNKPANKRRKLGNAAYVDTPAILIGVVLILSLMVLFTYAVNVSVRGFKLREMANTIAKRIGIEGRVSEDTCQLAKELALEIFEEEEKGYQFIQVYMEVSGGTENWTLMSTPGSSNVDDSGWSYSNHSYPYYDANNTYMGTLDETPIQLGDTVTVRIQYLNSNNPLTPIDFNSSTAGALQVKSTAVSQVYWKELADPRSGYDSYHGRPHS